MQDVFVDLSANSFPGSIPEELAGIEPIATLNAEATIDLVTFQSGSRIG